MTLDGSEEQELLAEFLVESNEGLDTLDRDLVTLEQTGSDPALLGRIFRCVHTIKGTCGFLGLGKLESVTHVGESLLSRLRDGALCVTPELTGALLALVDAIRDMLRAVEQSGSEGTTDYSALITELTRVADGVYSDVPRLGQVLIEQGVVAPADIAAAMDEQQQGNAARVGEILVARGVMSPVEIREALELQSESADARASGVLEGTIRVDVALLDKLMNLVGELVLARNQIVQGTARTQDTTLASTTQRLNLITTELQEGVMKTRMQPIGNVWARFPRVVRDLARTCGKQVVLEMVGSETELDRTIVEAIKDPLTHIIRNSVDHGIESPMTRVEQNKAPEGRLTLRAFHESGKVNIDIRDDGRGMDPAALRAKAVEKGVLTADAASRLSDHEALALIFTPGFSTAVAVTNVSGRGVGMDVVRTNIERIGGTVDVSSVIGEGTLLRIRIPLTLAIIPGLVITTGGQRYAIPQVNLLELLCLEGSDAKGRIEHVLGAPVYRLRGTLLPLLHLDDVLRVRTTRWTGQRTTAAGSDVGIGADEAINIVVLQADGVPFGVVVDRINDTEEIVVKPLGRQLKGIPAFAGATIMGDGHVALILDVLGLARQQGLLPASGERAAAESRDAAAPTATPMQQLLVFTLGMHHRAALRLSSISRLEEIPVSAIERTSESEVVQYRGRILPLIRLSTFVDGITPHPAQPESLAVVVCIHDGHELGLVVDRVLDIMECESQHADDGFGGSVSSTSIVGGHVTDILDMHALLQRIGQRHVPSRGLEHWATGRELAHVG